MLLSKYDTWHKGVIHSFIGQMGLYQIFNRNAFHSHICLQE